MNALKNDRSLRLFIIKPVFGWSSGQNGLKDSKFGIPSLNLWSEFLTSPWVHHQRIESINNRATIHRFGCHNNPPRSVERAPVHQKRTTECPNKLIACILVEMVRLSR